MLSQFHCGICTLTQVFNQKVLVQFASRPCCVFETLDNEKAVFVRNRLW
jgi:hypothetical protein